MPQMRKASLPSSTPNGGGGGPDNKSAANAANVDATASYLRLTQNQQARQNIHSLSELLNTGLSAQTLDICVRLCEAGVHPQSLAEVVRQLRNSSSSSSNDK